MIVEDGMETPRYTNTYNINTYATIVTFLVLFASIVASYAVNGSRLSEAESDLSEMRIDIGGNASRISEAKALAVTAQANQERLSDRVAQTEKAIESSDKQFDRLTDTIDDLKTDLNSVSTQVELSRQILLRMEAAQTNMMRNSVPGELAAPLPRTPSRN